MPELRTIAEEWEIASKVIDMDPAHLELIRQGFYSGAYALMVNIDNLTHRDIPLREGESYLDNIAAELQVFYDKQMEERNDERLETPSE